MATRAHYRPAAQGDGMGGIYLDKDQLGDVELLRDEAERYARYFRKEEDDRQFWIGVSCFSTVRAFVFTIEAARCLCAGQGFEKLAAKLLRMAQAELRRAMESI
jgi:hypothetical protein